MNKTTTTRIIKFTALILPLILIFTFFQEYLFDYRSYDTVRIENFYEEEENSHDVVFLGASEISTGFAPGYAYEKFGFTSYMYTMNANQGSFYLSQLKEILAHQDPEILFVDLYGFLRADDTILLDETRFRIYAESIPLSENKIRSIIEYPCSDKLSYFFPFAMYHGDLVIAYVRLAETFRQVVKEEKPISLKGTLTKTVIYPGPGDPGEAFDPATYKLTENSKAYLVEFLDYCRSNGLDNIVFTNFPRYIADENNHSLLHLLDEAEAIVAQYDYPVWNLQNEMELIGIDKSQDYYNEHHLNVYGQIKLTDYIGNKLINEYGISPRPQSESNKLSWEACAANTREFFTMATNAIAAGEDITISEIAVDWIYRK